MSIITLELLTIVATLTFVVTLFTLVGIVLIHVFNILR